MQHEALNDSSATVETALHAGPVSSETLSWPGDCGAEAVFLGRTRRQTHAEFGSLIRLEYEVYGQMAEQLLRGMADDAVRRFGCRAVRLAHARGPIEPGEASVVIQVAAPHRGEAFDACRYLIDRLKHELPVWKREIWQNGRTFVDGCRAHAAGSDGRSAQHTQL